MCTIIVFLISILLIGLSFLFKEKHNKTFNKVLKILTLVFCGIGLFKYFLSDSFVFVINGSTYNGVYYDSTDVLQTVLRWGYYLNLAVMPMAIFFDSRLFKNILSYFCLPFSILSAVFFNDFMAYYMSPKGPGLSFAEWFRQAYFCIELILAISIPVVMQIKHKHYFNVKDKKEWANFLICLPCIIVLMMPAYVPQSLIGYSKMKAEIGSAYHLIWLALTLVFVLVLYFTFRFKEHKSRYMLCVFLTIVLFYHYNSIFLMGFTIPRLPVQLCNLAAYIYMIAILFKRQKLFQFCFLANITGAFIALVASDFSGGAFGFWNMHFVYEHTLVLAIPALAMGLRIFPRIDRKAIKYTFIGFSIYFIFCFTVGTILNGYSDVTGTKVNYFFMFDLEKAFKYFPFLTRTGNIRWEFGRFEVFPVIVSIIYVAFSLLYLLFYKLTKYLYKFEDDRLELRRSAIELYENRTKKEFKLPKEYRE